MGVCGGGLGAWPHSAITFRYLPVLKTCTVHVSGWVMMFNETLGMYMLVLYMQSGGITSSSKSSIERAPSYTGAYE